MGRVTVSKLHYILTQIEKLDRHRRVRYVASTAVGMESGTIVEGAVQVS